MSRLPSSGNHDFEAQYLTIAAAIHQHLAQLQKAKAALLLSIKAGAQGYQSRLLQLDQQLGRMAIEEVVSPEANSLLRQAPRLHLSVQSDHGLSYWQVPEGTLRLASLDGRACYCLPMPAEIRHIQRRSSFRASCLFGQAPSLAILDGTGAVIAVGEMLDVSEQGCRFLCDIGGRLEWVAIGQRLRLRVEPQGQAAFELVAEVRHATQQDSQQAMMIGIRFVQLESVVARRLSQLVVQIQREHRRQQLDQD